MVELLAISLLTILPAVLVCLFHSRFWRARDNPAYVHRSPPFKTTRWGD